MNKLGIDKIKHILPAEKMGSYKKEDCIFLLKNINNLVKEQDNLSREVTMQKGGHYSEMLPIEYIPTDEYTNLYKDTLNISAKLIASFVASVSTAIYDKNGKDTLIVSLARAGTPVGVLIKRYIKYKYNVDIMHYSVSIIRDKGLDENAILYILGNHPKAKIQFVDGWTGKGVIGNSLKKSCAYLNKKYDINIDSSLAVLCDPGYCSELYGTREDLLVPSACLNSTISGLMSRTFLRDDIIGEYDFHGSKYYGEWNDIDLTNDFIDKISEHFSEIDDISKANEHIGIGKYINEGTNIDAKTSVENIKRDFDISSVNRIKPGVGEATRVLLRRVPWKILVRDENDIHLKHIILLAKDREVSIEVYKDMCYSCCGLIKDLSK